MNINVEYIPMEQLIVGRQYYCLARNFHIGIWNGHTFEYMRTKFTQTFQDEEHHWDEGPPYGTVKPLALILEEAENEA